VLTLALTLMDLPAEHFLENIRCIFHDRDLARHKLAFAGDRIGLTAIRTTALMTVEGAEGDIAAPGQTRAAHALCTSIPRRRCEKVLVDACGHFSLFHGRICRTKIVPEILGFIKQAESF
jgi:poly(3-hydroxybutyrate) depolymerase